MDSNSCHDESSMEETAAAASHESADEEIDSTANETCKNETCESPEEISKDATSDEKLLVPEFEDISSESEKSEREEEITAIIEDLENMVESQQAKGNNQGSSHSARNDEQKEKSSTQRKDEKAENVENVENEEEECSDEDDDDSDDNLSTISAKSNKANEVKDKLTKVSESGDGDATSEENEDAEMSNPPSVEMKDQVEKEDSASPPSSDSDALNTDEEGKENKNLDVDMPENNKRSQKKQTEQNEMESTDSSAMETDDDVAGDTKLQMEAVVLLDRINYHPKEIDNSLEIQSCDKTSRKSYHTPKNGNKAKRLNVTLTEDRVSQPRREASKRNYCELTSSGEESEKYEDEEMNERDDLLPEEAKEGSDDEFPSAPFRRRPKRMLAKINYSISDDDENDGDAAPSDEGGTTYKCYRDSSPDSLTSNSTKDAGNLKPQMLDEYKLDKKLGMEVVVVNRLGSNYLKKYDDQLLIASDDYECNQRQRTKSVIKTSGKRKRYLSSDSSGEDTSQSEDDADYSRIKKDQKLKMEIKVVLNRVCLDYLKDKLAIGDALDDDSLNELGPGGRRTRSSSLSKSSVEYDSNNSCNEDSRSEWGLEKKRKDKKKEKVKGAVHRKNIRALIDDNRLKGDTKAATKAEQERKKRVEEKRKLLGEFLKPKITESGKVTQLVLEVDAETKETLVEIHPSLVSCLKPHQAKGIQFLWDTVIESLQQLKDGPGSGCILAHSMGLGKTLQIIAFLQAVLTNELTKDHIRKVLIICPYNTLLNWISEFNMWLNNEDLSLKVINLLEVKLNKERALHLKKWQEEGGIVVIGYGMFRLLTGDKSRNIAKKWRDIFFDTLVYPGPDIVICDEGHLLKSSSTALAKGVSRMKTLRRIVLTGTPLQNNLTEYYCMVHFVKPHLLGTRREFQNRFVNPIMNGQCSDSTPRDVMLMKKRVHVLHTLLDGCVQRCDYSVLKPYLPTKHEYILSIRMTDVQVKMYLHYLENHAKKNIQENDKKLLNSGLFSDYTMLKDIWTHPWLISETMTRRNLELLYNYVSSDEDEKLCKGNASEEDKKKNSENKSDDIHRDDDDSDDSTLSSDDDTDDDGKRRNKDDNDEVVRQWKTRSRGEIGECSTSFQFDFKKDEEKAWWSEFVNADDETKIELSGKFILLFDIIKECEAIGDKLIVFSQSLNTLNLIESILADMTARNSEGLQDVEVQKAMPGTWIRGLDYFRLDGSTSVETRQTCIDAFNDANDRSRLFLISTKAGSLGTNLIGANRAVILDASWNPVDDIQAIFRIYRFGQTKPVFIYRFLSQGTMEEKIYNRQVNKESLSLRVVDEKQMERHFKAADLQELYAFDPDSSKKTEIPLVPKDHLLAKMLICHKERIINYHEHDSLLQKSPDEELTEEERKAAWVEYEAEREGLASAAASNQKGGEIKFKIQDTRNKLQDNLAKMMEDVKNKMSTVNPTALNQNLLNALSKTKHTYEQHKSVLLQYKRKIQAEAKPVPRTVTQRLSQINVVLGELRRNMSDLRSKNSSANKAPASAEDAESSSQQDQASSSWLASESLYEPLPKLTVSVVNKPVSVVNSVQRQPAAIMTTVKPITTMDQPVKDVDTLKGLLVTSSQWPHFFSKPAQLSSSSCSSSVSSPSLQRPPLLPRISLWQPYGTDAQSSSSSSSFQSFQQQSNSLPRPQYLQQTPAKNDSKNFIVITADSQQSTVQRLRQVRHTIRVPEPDPFQLPPMYDTAHINQVPSVPIPNNQMEAVNPVVMSSSFSENASTSNSLLRNLLLKDSYNMPSLQLPGEQVPFPELEPDYYSNISLREPELLQVPEHPNLFQRQLHK